MYIVPKSTTERPRKTKIGTEVGHVTRESDTTFKVKRSKVNLQLQGAGYIVVAYRTACSELDYYFWLNTPIFPEITTSLAGSPKVL